MTDEELRKLVARLESKLDHIESLLFVIVLCLGWYLYTLINSGS